MALSRPTNSSGPPPSQSGGRRFGERLGYALLVVGLMLAAMWVVEVLDTLALDERLEREGIHPRRLDGLDGVLWAPFLHGGWAHLIGNSMPLAVLGVLTFVHGRRRGWMVVAAVISAGGLLTWVLARSGNHIGASGLVFGLLGYLLAAALFARRLREVATAILAGLLYGGLVWGFLPSPGVSWESHVFGFAAGVGSAYALGRDN
ncbi:MAG: rhomboid family intramembrane serine protease [Acidimicrobiales bacterium]|nr:rhomboid family intramembrane serine protease [Acidimicrobiales bacterium]